MTGLPVQAADPGLDLHFNPIQYHTPLYQLMARRGRIELDVLFLTDDGHGPVVDTEFGVPVAWDIDLLSGYEHQFLTTAGRHPLALEPRGAPCAMGF